MMSFDPVSYAMGAKSGGGGSGGGVLVVHDVDDTGALDKTGQEILDAFFTSTVFFVYGAIDDGGSTSERLEAVELTGGKYNFYFKSVSSANNFSCDSLNDYPV